ncbi:MAG TPA: PilZ domain-containing protein [Terriglobia bacterium]|nr:PilZ domain-containing protein [Terriglobia bacterium]
MYYYSLPLVNDAGAASGLPTEVSSSIATCRECGRPLVSRDWPTENPLVGCASAPAQLPLIEKKPENRRQDRRASDRVKDDSVLCVRGLSSSPQPINERTRIKDISAGGIAFWLKWPVEVGDELDLLLCPRELDESLVQPKYQVSGKVLRIHQSDKGAGEFLIAVRFEGEIRTLGRPLGTDQIAEALEKAVEYDEAMRLL